MRSRKKTILLLSAALITELVIIAGLCIGDSMAESKQDVTVRYLSPQTVLYTIHRGHYDNIGSTIDRLYELAVEKGMCPCGPLSTGYLNNPTSVSSEHWLVEVRLPVNAAALEFAGTLGRMTDVKKLPARKVAVAVKLCGYADPRPVIKNLYSWIDRNDYIVTGRMWQMVTDNDEDDYTGMRTEFVVPIDSKTAKVNSVLRFASII